jgi:hypothetical protein
MATYLCRFSVGGTIFLIRHAPQNLCPKGITCNRPWKLPHILENRLRDGGEVGKLRAGYPLSQEVSWY